MVISILLITANIIIRLFGGAFNGSVEIVVNFNALIAFLGLGLCALEDGHIKVDIIKRWPGLDHICAFLTIVGFAVLGYSTVLQGQMVYKLNTQTAVLYIVKWPFYFATAIGYFSSLLALIGHEVNSFVNWLSKRKNDPEALLEN